MLLLQQELQKLKQTKHPTKHPHVIGWFPGSEAFVVAWYLLATLPSPKGFGLHECCVLLCHCYGLQRQRERRWQQIVCLATDLDDYNDAAIFANSCVFVCVILLTLAVPVSKTVPALGSPALMNAPTQTHTQASMT